MKWIDDQDDYFLHDFNNKNKNEDSSDNSTQPSEAGPDEFTFPEGTAADDNGGDAPAEAPVRKRRRTHRRLVWFLLIVFIVLCTAFYIRYFVPYTSDTLTTGYITLVEKRGLFFKTFEGEMISESMLADTSKVYSRDFFFSIPNDSLGRLVQSYQGTGKRVTLTTQKYYGTLPWRGSQKSVVTAVTPAPTK